MWRSVVLFVVAGCGFSSHLDPGTAPQDAPVDTLRAIDAAVCAGPDTDGDGVNDPCDQCPMDKPDDSDGDGVCNSADRCPQGNDAADVDTDAIPDACDDWPCGPKPSSPPSTVAWTTTNENITLTFINVANQGQRAVTTPGASIAVSALYSIFDCQCPTCIDQIEIGFHTIGKAGCLYNGNPNGNGNCNVPATGMEIRMINAPVTPGSYELRFNRGNDTSCQANGTWWANVAPGAANRFAFVCVR